jgi:hypothetical protein
MESWRRYLNEISFDKAKESLVSKKTKKMLYHHYKHKIETRPSDRSQESVIDSIVSVFRTKVLNAIPNDLEDNQKATAVLWFLRVLRNNDKNLKTFMMGGTDTHKTIAAIEQFFHYQRFMSEQDIMKIESFEDLWGIVEDAEEAINAYQKKQDYGFVQEGTEVFRDDDEWYIAAIHNKSAACELGKETKWCTAHPGGTYFEEYYRKDSPLFYLKGNNTKRFQVHYGNENYSPQFKVENDLEVRETLRYKLHDLIKNTDAFQKYPKIKEYDDETKAENPNTPPEELMELARDIKKHPKSTQSMLLAKNPSTPSEALDLMVYWVKEEDIVAEIAIHENLLEKSMWPIVRFRADFRAVGAGPNLAHIALSKNPNATTEILDQLFKLKSGGRVTRNIARHKNTSKDILWDLAGYWDEDIIIEVAQREDLDEKIATKIANINPKRYDNPTYVLEALANNVHVPIRFIEDLYIKAALKGFNSRDFADADGDDDDEDDDISFYNDINHVVEQAARQNMEDDRRAPGEFDMERLRKKYKAANKQHKSKKRPTPKKAPKKKNRVDENYLRLRQLSGVNT